MPARRLPHHRPVTIAALAAAAVAVAASPATAAPTGPPQLRPASGTPHFPNSTQSVEQVRQLVECGSTMYAVGTFTTIISGSTTLTRNNAFSFSATKPYTVTSWAPNVNGTVNSIGFNGSDCSNAYLGGKFSAVNGTAVQNLAKVSTTTGAVATGFHNKASGEVDTVLGWNGHILVGGKFTGIGGSTANPYFASLNPSSGLDDGYLHLGISGNYVYTDNNGNHAASNATRVYNVQLSHGGNRLLVEGDFTSIGGQARRQVAILDLGQTTATTDAWHAAELDIYCTTVEPFYAKAASWSPDDSTVYVATTGYIPATGPGSRASDQRAGPCDAAIAYPSTPGQVSHKWINYTGCDSLYSTAADDSTAYFGGHERWASNPNGCDGAGAGAINAPGMVGLSPANGSVTFNPTRSRGVGADDMEVTPQGLWIASDNFQNETACAGFPNLGGICLLPY
jgi:hypothetical protein